MRGSRAQGSGRRPVLRLLATVVTLVAAVTLSGCQSNPEPPPVEAAPSPSPSPTEPTTEPAPTIPAEAQGTSRAAAKAFVRHYVELVNYGMRTGDTEPLQNLARESCATCDAIADRVNEVYRAGGRLEGDGWTVRSLTYVSAGDPKHSLVAAGIDIAPQVAYASAGASPSRSPQSRGNLDFRLAMTPNGWRVDTLEATQ